MAGIAAGSTAVQEASHGSGADATAAGSASKCAGTIARIGPAPAPEASRATARASSSGLAWRKEPPPRHPRIGIRLPQTLYVGNARLGRAVSQKAMMDGLVETGQETTL